MTAWRDKKENIEQLKAEHTPDAIQQRLHYGYRHSYLRDFIYGAIDGVVTTFAVVSGVAGANLSAKIIIILGIANLIGDGFSMAVSNFLGTRADEQQRQQAIKEEELHIQKIPEGEREEIRQIFAAKGFTGKNLERAVKIITSDSQLWVNTMLREELGMVIEGPSAIRAALSTFVAFVLIGSLPLLAFIYQWLFPDVHFDPFLVSSIMTGIAFFSVGALKAPFIGHRWYLSGLETFLVGVCAALLAYTAGILLRGIV